MENNQIDERKKFKVTYHGLTLEFEFFTKSFILKKLQELESEKIISSVRCINIPNEKGPFKKLKKYYEDEQKNRRYYFAYIKFFEYEDNQYGLVGGKTNYNYPDIDFTKDSDTIARTFLNENKYDWCRDIVLVNYNKENYKNQENKQVVFLERFLQRKFNLFDS